MDKDKVIKMAELARIHISEQEADGLAIEIASIIEYVGQIEKMQIGDLSLPNLRNVMREDSESHGSGDFTDSILENAPQRQGDLLKVKKIL